MSPMNAPSPLEIELLPATAALDGGLVGEITDLVNRVYATAEEGLWVDGATRTTTTETAEMIADGQIAVARMNGQMVGSVGVQELESGEGELGMLVADPTRRGEGIGRELVLFAEELSRRRGRVVLHVDVGRWQSIKTVTEEAGGPVNILVPLSEVNPHGPVSFGLSDLAELGVRRISLGGSLYRAQVAHAADRVRTLLADGSL
jgi:ribosomal protein S18 acetylase RimI-like enzyme